MGDSDGAGSDDADGDGLLDFDELAGYEILKPYESSFYDESTGEEVTYLEYYPEWIYTDPTLKDTDGDLIEDLSELQLGMDPTDPSDGDVDGDDDSLSLGREMQLGTSDSEPDHDFDLIDDGIEVLILGTDPLDPNDPPPPPPEDDEMGRDTSSGNTDSSAPSGSGAASSSSDSASSGGGSEPAGVSSPGAADGSSHNPTSSGAAGDSAAAPSTPAASSRAYIETQEVSVTAVDETDHEGTESYHLIDSASVSYTEVEMSTRPQTPSISQKGDSGYIETLLEEGKKQLSIAKTWQKGGSLKATSKVSLNEAWDATRFTEVGEVNHIKVRLTRDEATESSVTRAFIRFVKDPANENLPPGVKSNPYSVVYLTIPPNQKGSGTISLEPEVMIDGEERIVSLLPVEVLVPREGSDSNGYDRDELATTDKLKVAKWEDAFNDVTGTPSVKQAFNESDVDRFYLRVPLPWKKGEGTATIKLKTDSDPENEIEVVEITGEPGVFRTNGLILVSNEVDDDVNHLYPEDGDDEALDDITHMVKLGDTVTFTVTNPHGADIVYTANVPARAEIDVTVRSYAVPDVRGPTEIDEAVEKIGQLFAQIGIQINPQVDTQLEWPVNTLNSGGLTIYEYERHPGQHPNAVKWTDLYKEFWLFAVWCGIILNSGCPQVHLRDRLWRGPIPLDPAN